MTTPPTIETFEEAWVALLGTLPGVAALVGERIYPSTLDFGGDFPALVVSTVSNTPTFSQEGHSGFTRERISIDAFAKNAIEVDRLSKQLRDAFKSYKGLLTIGDGAYRVDGVLFQSQTDGYHAGPKLHHRVHDFMVLHSE